MATKPSIERLREVFRLDPATGVLTWSLSFKNRRAGKVAGNLHSTGYVQVGLDDLVLKAHQIVWAIEHGEWPREHIDHINGDKADNRPENLRDVNRAVNAQNIRTAHPHSRTGVLGVIQRDKRFIAQIKLPRKDTIHLGSFKTAEEAHAAYLAAKRRLHEGNTL